MKSLERDLAAGGTRGLAIAGNTRAGKSTLLAALCVALFDRSPRLTNHRRVVVGRGEEDRASARRLAELDLRDVFLQPWTREHAEPPSHQVVAGFDRLLAEVSGDAADPEARPPRLTHPCDLDPRDVFLRPWALEPRGQEVVAGADRLLAEVAGDPPEPEAS